jgi:YcaO-like protein with predicted kinase domain
VARVTGLDYIGIPVFLVVRPASRNLSVMQGKGLTDDAAIASGLGEALESFCSEQISEPTQRRTFSRAASDQTFVVSNQMLRCVPPSEERLQFSECRDLLGGPSRFFPSELIFADFSSPPPPGQGYFNVSTNGLAVGNSEEEAILHSLCELIERDAVALWMLGQQKGLPARPLDTNGIKKGSCLQLLDMLGDSGLQFNIWDITSDLGIPTFFCVIDDRYIKQDLSIGRIAGAGCHPSSDVAICRAITEAAQARLTLITGARDDINLDFYQIMSCNSLLTRIFPPSDFSQETFEDRSCASNDIKKDLITVLTKLEAGGIATIAFSHLPCPVDNMRCVRVLAPKLEGVFEMAWYCPGERARNFVANLP